MPLAPAVAAALTNHAAHPWGLFQGGSDLIKDPGGSGLGVDPGTIEVTEAGPGGVSSMRYLVDDPTKALTILAGTEVQFWDLTNNVCLFRGWVDHYVRRPDFGGQGRTIEVECTGVEAILDWTICPAATQFVGAQLPRYIGMAAQLYAPQLRAPVDTGMGSAPYTQNGSFSYPVGSMRRSVEPKYPLSIAGGPLPAGTLRERIRNICGMFSWWQSDLSGASTLGIAALYTVDFYFGLRVWEDDPSLQPDDYTTLSVTDTFAATPPNAAGLQATVDWSGIIRQVYVAGVDAASSGYFGDGTGIYGPTTLLADTSITTADVAAQRAAGLMAEQAAETRGTFTLEDFTPATTVHAGSLVTITDGATGLAATHRIMEIRKSFLNSQRQTWTVTFGGLPAASVTRLTRRFTRASLN